MEKLNDINEIINIQFRIPKRFVNDFNDFVNSIGHGASHNQVVKAVVVKWLEKKFNEVNDVSNVTNKAEPIPQDDSPEALNKLVANWD